MDIRREVLEMALPSPADRRRIRQLAGFQVVEVAALLGVHRVTVHVWESGKREPHGEYRRRYSGFLGEARRALAAEELPG